MAQAFGSRWTVVLGALIVQIILGTVYAFSVFVKPLETEFGWDRATTQWAFSIALATFAVVMIPAGRLQDRQRMPDMIGRCPRSRERERSERQDDDRRAAREDHAAPPGPGRAPDWLPCPSYVGPRPIIQAKTAEFGPQRTAGARAVGRRRPLVY